MGSPIPFLCEELLGAINGVDDPAAARVDQVAACLFAEHVIRRTLGLQQVQERTLDCEISFSDRRRIGVQVVLRATAEVLPGHSGRDIRQLVGQLKVIGIVHLAGCPKWVSEALLTTPENITPASYARQRCKPSSPASNADKDATTPSPAIPQLAGRCLTRRGGPEIGGTRLAESRPLECALD